MHNKNLSPHERNPNQAESDKAPYKANTRFAWAAVFVLAITVRLIHLSQIKDFVLFENLIGDAKGYDAWAQRIADGQWRVSEGFYQAPFYPYLLAAIYTIVGHDLWWLRVIQSVLGSAACVMTGLAGTAMLSRRIGFIAGVCMALYPPAIYFDGIVQKAALVNVLMAAVLWLLAICMKHPGIWKWGFLGLSLGLLPLARENALLLVPLIVGWAIFRKMADIEERWKSLVPLLAGITVPLTAVGVHNASIGGSFSITTFQMGPNFFMGNNTDADGRYFPLVPGRETFVFERADATRIAEQQSSRSLTPREVSDYWMRAALRDIQADPVSWIRLMALKWWLAWNRYEIPDTESYYVYRDESRALAWLGAVWHFGVLCPLAFVGACLGWSRRRELWPLLLIPLLLAVAVAIFYVFGRYRYVIVAPLIILAAAGIVNAATWLKAGGDKGSRWVMVAVAAIAVWVNWPINPESELNAAQLGNVGATLAEQGRLPEAIDYFERSVADYPQAPRLRQFLADALSLSGRYAEAIPHYRSVLKIEPNRPMAAFNLAVALENVGRLDEAFENYQHAIATDPEDSDAARAVERLDKRR